MDFQQGVLFLSTSLAIAASGCRPPQGEYARPTQWEYARYLEVGRYDDVQKELLESLPTFSQYATGISYYWVVGDTVYLEDEIESGTGCSHRTLALMEFMDCVGEAGWELVSVDGVYAHPFNVSGARTIYYYFKRPLRD